jgi:hypothetical protein
MDKNLSQDDSSENKTGIRDNHHRGKVADFLIEKISEESELSVVSAYFTIYAYEALAEQLEKISGLRFLFGEPRFITSLDPEKTDKKSFKIEDERLELLNPASHWGEPALYEGEVKKALTLINRLERCIR